LKNNPIEINKKYLKQFPEFVEFESLKKDITDIEKYEIQYNKQTPQELLDNSYQTIKKGIAEEILNLIKNCSPNYFEKIVVELLIKMGYGGSRKDAGEALGRTGDEGIDGIIKEDKLGLDVIYIQAKRWSDTNVGRPEIQKFAGALQGQKAKKGIFITTSNFSNEAIDYVNNIENKIVLINGEKLAQLMYDHDIGVIKEDTYEIKKIDLDYFPEE